MKARKGLNNRDCIAACLRTITDDDDVPHLFDGRPAQEAWKGLSEYFRKKKKDLILESVDDPWTQYNEDEPYVLLCRTLTGNHALVCLNGEVFSDPNKIKFPIVGPHSMGVWIVVKVRDLPE
jgi:hypothetical protein